MKARFASDNDLKLIENFFSNQQDKEEAANFYKHCFENRSANHDIKIAICLSNEEIVSLKLMILRNFSPSWISGGLCVYPKQTYFNCKTNGVSQLMTHCVEYAESLGYYCYEWHQTVGKTYTNRFERMRDQIETLKRYDHYDVGIISAYKGSRFKTFDMMLRQIKGTDILIKSAQLKNEFRKIPNFSNI